MRNTRLKTDVGEISFSVNKTIWMYLILIPTIFIDWNSLTIKDYSLFLCLLILTVGIGHSIGLHRGVIHKSYQTSRIFRNISIYLFTLTGMGSPINWLKQHYFRDYWQNRKDCPTYFRYKHSLFTDYIWNLHLKFEPTSIDRYEIPKKDLNDPWFLWLHRTWYIHNIVFLGLIYFIFNINTMLFLGCFRIGLVILGHWYIGYASHKYGYSRHTIENADESGYNDMVLGLISFGEGFHNNHHAFPKSAKFSSKWYEIDLSWYLILILKKIGVIYNTKTQCNNLKKTAKNLGKIKWTLPWN